jgi:hypothetical protein
MQISEMAAQSMGSRFTGTPAASRLPLGGVASQWIYALTETLGGYT